MERVFFLQFGDSSEFVSQEQLSAFISGAVYHNRDIQSFMVTEIDSRLTMSQAMLIASEFNLANEVAKELKSGVKPYVALLEWVK